MKHRIDAQRRNLLATAELVLGRSANPRAAFVVMNTAPDGTVHCDLVALCEVTDLIVAASYLLGVARDRLDVDCPSCRADAAAVDVALRALPCGRDHDAERLH